MEYDSTKDCDAEYDSSFLARKLNNIVNKRKIAKESGQGKKKQKISLSSPTHLHIIFLTIVCYKTF